MANVMTVSDADSLELFAGRLKFDKYGAAAIVQIRISVLDFTIGSLLLLSPRERSAL